MKRIPFFMVLALVIVGAFLMWMRLRNEARLLRDEAALSVSSRVESTPRPGERETDRSVKRGVSPELLRLRDEIQKLRRELREVGSLPFTREQTQADWDWVHKGMRPSDWPGFIRFEKTEPSGNASPDAAFLTFQHAMRNQAREPLNPTRMKDLWDVPDDFDQSPGYNIDLGEGMGSEVGYRIVSREAIATNEVRIEVEYETPDGGSFRRSSILVERHGKYRVKPARLSRVQPEP